MSLLACLPLLLVASHPAQDSQEDGAPLLDRSRAALGSAEALQGISTLQMKGTAGWKGVDLGKGTFEETLAGPRQALLRSTFPGLDPFTLGATDGLVWDKPPGTINVKRGWVACADLRQYGLLQHTPWRELYSSATASGTEKVGDVECLKVLATPRAMVPVPGDSKPIADTWYLDPKTHLPVRIEVGMGDSNSANPIRVGIAYSDWRAVDGILFAHQRDIDVQGFTLLLTYEAIALNPKLEEGWAEPGDDVRAKALEVSSQAKREIEVMELEEVHTATIRVESSPDDLTATFGEILPEVFTTVMGSGGQMGVVFARYHSVGEVFDVEGGLTLSGPIEPKGRVEASTLPACTAVIGWHIGPYEKLGGTHARMTEWMAANGFEAAGPHWEEYVTDPSREPDPAKYETRVVMPAKKKSAKKK